LSFLDTTQTEVDGYLDAGSLSTRAGVDQSRLHEAITDIVREYKICADMGVTPDELQRAKDYLKGKITLAMEDSEERAHFYGKQELLYPEIRDVAEYFGKIDAVSVKDVNELAAQLLKPELLRLVVIGKEEKKDVLEGLLK
jgi:predicted Zn-dependent peptidase